MSENVKQSHEKYYDDYIDRQIKMGINHRHFSIEKHLINQGLKSNHQVLEIGAGIGPVTGLIAGKLKEGEIVANDISGESLKVAESRLQKYNNIKYIKGDVINLEIKGLFDFIVLPDVLEHIPIEEHGQLFKKLHSLLKNDGKIFIHIPNPLYLEWVQKNQPELLQELDQALHLNLIFDSIDRAGLYIQYLENYSIYIKENDYQVIVLKKKNVNLGFTSQNIRPDSFFKKVLRRIKG